MARKERQSTEITQRFASILKDRLSALVKAGATHREVADGIGITPSQLSDYLNDKKTPTMDVFARMCQYFGLSSDYVLDLQSDYLHEQKKRAQMFTGLSDLAIDTLETMKNRDAVSLTLIDRFICNADKDDPISFLYGLRKGIAEAMGKRISEETKTWDGYSENDFLAGFPDAYIRMLTERYIQESVHQYQRMIHTLIRDTWDEYKANDTHDDETERLTDGK